MQHMKLAYDYARAVGEMIEKRFGQGVTVRYDETLEDDPIILIDEWIEISPIEVEIKSIKGPTKVPGYLLSIEVVQHNYPHAPDDVDVNELKEFHHAGEVVTEAFHLWFDCWIENAVENERTRQHLEIEGSEF